MMKQEGFTALNIDFEYVWATRQLSQEKLYQLLPKNLLDSVHSCRVAQHIQNRLFKAVETFLLHHLNCIVNYCLLDARGY